MIGERIRESRLAQERSLVDVSRKAKISVATLSRIENDKQTLDIPTFLVLARVLKRAPDELLGADATPGDGMDPMVRKISQFEAAERARLWRELALARRTARGNTRRVQLDHIAAQIEEVLAQISFLQEELVELQKRLKRR